MTDTQLTLQLVLTGMFFTSAIIFDLYQEKIPNKLCLLAIFCGFAINAYFAQLDGVLMATFGFGLAFILLFPTFIFRILGGGDIKLMMGIGALMGPELIFSSLVYGIVAGAATSLALIIWKTGFTGVWKTMKRYWVCFYLQSYFKPEPGEAAGLTVPYAPALAIGWLWASSLDKDIVALFQNWSLYLKLGVT